MSDPSAELARVLSNRWRSRILLELAERPMSPSQFVVEVGGEISNVSRCFRMLAEQGYIDLLAERSGGPRRGGVEHVFGIKQRAHLSWDPVTLDEAGFEKLADRLNEVREWLPGLQAEAALRLKQSGEEPAPTTVGLAAVRAPRGGCSHL